MDTTTLSQAGFPPLEISADIFTKLYNKNISKLVERRGSGGSSFKASYLSWAHAYKLMKAELPNVMVDFEKTADGNIVHQHQYGHDKPITASVRPFLTDGLTRTTAINFPIMDNRFGAIEEPDAREVSDACQRGAVKAIAIYTGLGLPLYSGEDIPKDDSATTTPADKDDVFENPPKRTNNVPADKVYLDVPFKKKDDAKQLGARWDGSAKKWYATPDNIDALAEFIVKAKGDETEEEIITPPDEIAEQSAGDPTDPEADEDVPF